MQLNYKFWSICPRQKTILSPVDQEQVRPPPDYDMP